MADARRTHIACRGVARSLNAFPKAIRFGSIESWLTSVYADAMCLTNQKKFERRKANR